VYPKAKLVIYDPTPSVRNVYYFHKQSYVITKEANADTVPVWNTDFLKELLATEAQDNNKIFCEQFKSSLLAHAYSTLAVIIKYFSSVDKFKSTKEKFAHVVKVQKEICKQELLNWIVNILPNELINNLNEKFKDDKEWRIHKNNYVKVLIEHIQTFFPEKVGNKVAEICDQGTKTVCKDIITYLKSESFQNNTEIDINESGLLFLPDILFTGGIVIGIVELMLTATGIGVIIGIVLALSSVAFWTREGAHKDVVMVFIDKLKSVLPTLNNHIDKHFENLRKNVDEFLTVTFTGVGGDVKGVLVNDKLYNQIQKQITSIKLINTK